MQGLGGAQGFHGGVAVGQLAVGEEAMDATVAGLAEVYGIAVAAAFLAGHQVVAAGALHLALAKAAARIGGGAGAGSGFGGGLLALVKAAHEVGQNRGLLSLNYWHNLC